MTLHRCKDNIKMELREILVRGCVQIYSEHIDYSKIFRKDLVLCTSEEFL